ncbi:hypothetical protein BO82DRAFT_347115 [Aspergillus uvarum CBS 121591]|uniref:C2H2-type domain-containing protein n=1 Tax=Aspergillus uvarum CBS 121591 TaxID=1448315 RepID=A0A319BVK5_9EURO|nr:hypothetical protein BO82DRAFT_347115 [Aspergillus uvarum CBS 121591]PYH76431.1 hypothetical protein BO82DRAFT_347115 [Aspergillus uvarum CBS 121591]
MAARSSAWKEAQAEKRRKASRELRRQRGYDARAHIQKDAERTRGRASAKTKEMYKQRVRKYEEFLVEERNMPKGYKIGEGHPVPTLQDLKAFIRWLVASTEGTITSDKRPTMHTILIRAQEFVPGFFFETGNEISNQDRKDLYYWIEHNLVEEGLLSTIRKPKFNFKLEDFERVMTTLWTADDPFFISGRHRIQFHFATLQFLYTGARVSSFTPPLAERDGKGLRYKNIQLVLFRARDVPWRVGWRVDQQFVKNNKDPENTMFGTALWECDEPIYSGALYLVALALADKALFGFTTPEEFFEQRIPEGQNELVLRWNDEARNRCIIRSATAEGVSEDPMTKESYQADFRRIMAAACYYVTATVHAMRRALGAAVEEKYSLTHTAQILTQKSTAVFGNNYLADCSSVDATNTVRRKPVEHAHVEYFQGFGQFHEAGLPRRLPFEEEQSIGADPRLQAKLKEICDVLDGEESKRIHKEHMVLRREIYSKRLQQYQSEWVQSRRDWKILTRGRERSDQKQQVAEKQVLCKLMPELGRLAAIISSNAPLSFDEKASVVRDLYTQCLRDFTVVYRPGEEPVQGRCPVASCGLWLESKSRSGRNSHIHGCLRQEYARSTRTPLRQVKYCWECFTFHDGKSSEFEEHCANHLPSMTSQHYEMMVYRNTITRAGYCIECMWDEQRSAACRMRAYERSDELREHLEGHISLRSWPSGCPDPSCHYNFSEEQDYRRHLHDVHRYHKTICAPPGKALKKRPSSVLDDKIRLCQTQPMQDKKPPKRRKKLSTMPARDAKELEIIFWDPHAVHPKSIAAHERLKTLAWHAENYHSAGVVGEDQNRADASSVTLDTPDLTDDSSTCSSPSTACSTYTAVDIDPRLLEIPPPFLSQPIEKADQPNAYSPWEHEEVQVGIEQLEAGDLHQITDDLLEQELPGEDVASSEMDTRPIEQASSSLTKLDEEPASSLDLNASFSEEKTVPTVQGDASICLREKRTVEKSEPAGPLTRAKAREQAAESVQISTRSHSSSRKALPYSLKEDELLKVLMRELSTLDAATSAFQKRFPSRSASSLRKRWSSIQPSSRRSTRSRILRSSQGCE